MAKTKKAVPAKKEESFTEKIGHVIGSAADAIAGKFNELVHPDTKKPVKKKTAKKAAAKKTVPARKKTVTKPVAKKTASKAPMKKTASKKPVKKTGAKK